jgi:hypothetical protein
MVWSVAGHEMVPDKTNNSYKCFLVLYPIPTSRSQLRECVCFSDALRPDRPGVQAHVHLCDEREVERTQVELAPGRAKSRSRHDVPRRKTRCLMVRAMAWAARPARLRAHVPAKAGVGVSSLQRLRLRHTRHERVREHARFRRQVPGRWRRRSLKIFLHAAHAGPPKDSYASHVMAALVPATHEHPCSGERMGRRDEPGDDEEREVAIIESKAKRASRNSGLSVEALPSRV